MLVAVSARRLLAGGAILAALGCAWFALGGVIGQAWAGLTPGAAVGGTAMRALEQIGFFTGLGSSSRAWRRWR